MKNEDLKKFIGKKVDEAKKELPEDYFFFIAENNGRTFYKTYEYNKARINIAVSNDTIYKVFDIG